MMTGKTKNAKVFNTALWAAQLLLSAGLLWAAWMKLFYPAAELAGMWPWTAANPALVPISGIADLLGGLGLVLPGLFRIRPGLTVYAAWGVVLLMFAAATLHVSRGEGDQIGINVFFAALAAFVGWGRSRYIRNSLPGRPV